MFCNYLQHGLNTIKSTFDNTNQLQVNHKSEQQLSSTEFITKTLLDLCDKEQLTTDQIKNEKDVLNKLIKVCNPIA